MAKNPALMQVDTTNLQHLIQSMRAVVDAAGVSGTDGRKLVALVQSRQGGENNDEAAAEADEEALGAPAAAVYKTHSTSIVEVLQDLLEKAETSTAHNYDMLKQSLEDQIAADEGDMEETKA